MGASCCKSSTTDDLDPGYISRYTTTNRTVSRAVVERSPPKIVPVSSIIGPPIVSSGNMGNMGSMGMSGSFNVYGAPVPAYMSETGRNY